MTEETKALAVQEKTELMLPRRPQLSYLDAIKAIDAIAPDNTTAMRTFGMSAEQAKFCMWTGYELGLSFTGALRVLYIDSSGRITLKPKGAWAIIQSSGLLEWYKVESNDNEVTFTIKRKGREPVTMSLSIAQAKRAGWKSAAWEATPQNMLRWRLIGWIADLDWTDLTLGLPTADDSYMNIEITEDGDVFEGQAVEVKVPMPPSVEKAQYVTTDSDGNTTSVNNLPTIPDYGYTLDKLLESIADEEILVVTNGEFPVTPEQVNIAVHKLVEAGKMKVEEDDDQPND